jgi:NAD(P)H-hydrate epimerase
MKIVTAEHLRSLDRRTIEEAGVPGCELMERAGRGIFAAAQAMDVDRKRGVVLFAGKGNNGGDAIVVARHLLKAKREWGPVTLVLMAPASQLTGDPLRHWKKLRPLRPKVIIFNPANKDVFASLLSDCGLIVDGLLGTGARGEPRSPIREAIELINAAGKPVLAIDIPSGLDSDTGQPASVCVRANVTVTMGLPKTGLLRQQALDHVGRLEVVDIGIPRKFVEALPVGPEYFVCEDAAALLPARSVSAHKGDFGHVLVLAGSEGMTGAAVLASQAAMRSGVGLCTLGVPRAIWPIVAAQCREVMPKPFDDWSPAALAPALERCNAVAAGPGLGQSSATETLVGWLLQNCAHPLVLDADALNVLAKNPAQLRQARRPVIITPHPGEMARLIGKTTQDAQTDRWGVAAKFAREFNVVVALKGARTVVASPNGNISINSTGNPGMASGGVGDVLTGIVAALLAQGSSAFDAARLGVWLHGAAADFAAQKSGEEALIASDITANLGAAFRSLRRP